MRNPLATRATQFLVLSLVLLAVTYAAYHDSFHAPFIFDDLVTIERNTMVQAGQFRWSMIGGRWLLYLTFTGNVALLGGESWGFHVVNFGLHVVNGLLVMLLAAKILSWLEIDIVNYRFTCWRYPRYLWAAGASAALFLVHPIQTESVTYISSRSELLSTVFYLLGMVAFVYWPLPSIGMVCFGVVGLMFVLGIGAKETVMTLPASIFLYDWLFLSRCRFLEPLKLRWRFYLPFVVGGMLVAYRTVTVLLMDVINNPVNLPVWQYGLTQLHVVVRYIRLVLVPVGLNMDHDVPVAGGVLEPMTMASLVVLIGIVGLAWTVRRTNPVVAFAVFWFFITLSPTSSVVPIRDLMFEHRLYLPMVGVAVGFPVLVRWLWGRVWA